MVLPAETNEPVSAAFTPIFTVLSSAAAPLATNSAAAATNPQGPRLIGFVLLPWLALSGESKSSYDPITLPVNSSLLCRKHRRGTRSASYSTLSLHHRWCTEGLMLDSIP